MITVRNATEFKGKLIVDFESDTRWQLKPGDLLRSGDVTIRFKQIGMNHTAGEHDVYSFLGESDFPPEQLIGKTFDVIQ